MVGVEPLAGVESSVGVVPSVEVEPSAGVEPLAEEFHHLAFLTPQYAWSTFNFLISKGVVLRTFSFKFHDLSAARHYFWC